MYKTLYFIILYSAKKVSIVLCESSHSVKKERICKCFSLFYDPCAHTATDQTLLAQTKKISSKIRYIQKNLTLSYSVNFSATVPILLCSHMNLAVVENTTGCTFRNIIYNLYIERKKKKRKNEQNLK